MREEITVADNEDIISKFMERIHGDWVVIKTEFHLSYLNDITYDICYIGVLYDFLNNRIESEDSKNGVHLYIDNGTVYLCITGSNYYINDEYAGTDEVHVYIKEFVW